MQFAAVIDSLSSDQINRVRELGQWRDQGHRFAIGLDGEVFTHTESEVEVEYAAGQQGERSPRTSGASAPSPAPAAPAAAQSAGSHRRESLRRRYLALLPQVKGYYPTLKWCEVDRGLWAVTPSYTLGRGGPRFWLCLFLPDDPAIDPKAFAFERVAPFPTPGGPRHTNYPDGSICSHIPQDDALRPGDDPLVLLNLCAEWLLCHLFLKLEERWPGRQFGMDAVYRHAEFRADEWCTCDSGRPYGQCHGPTDAEAIAQLKFRGVYQEHGPRVVPKTIVDFARSIWKRKPTMGELHLHLYRGLPQRLAC